LGRLSICDSKPNDEHVSSPRSVFTNYQVCAGENERHCGAFMPWTAE
jgi:hypothetical protein